MCVLCCCVVVCVLMLYVVLCEEEGEAQEARRRCVCEAVRRCQPKNKNPTRQCGEKLNTIFAFKKYSKIF